MALRAYLYGIETNFWTANFLKLRCCEPTYMGLKPTISVTGQRSRSSCEPTYMGLKHWSHRLYDRPHKVASLPIWDWNIAFSTFLNTLEASGCEPTYMGLKPRQKRAAISIQFCCEPTYMGLKPLCPVCGSPVFYVASLPIWDWNDSVAASPVDFNELRAYLYGIETRFPPFHSLQTYHVASLPIWDWNR